jgi:hypothetical protein
MFMHEAIHGLEITGATEPVRGLENVDRVREGLSPAMFTLCAV